MNDQINRAITGLVNAAYDTGWMSGTMEHITEPVKAEDRKTQATLIKERERCVNVLIEEIDNEGQTQYEALVAALRECRPLVKKLQQRPDLTPALIDQIGLIMLLGMIEDALSAAGIAVEQPKGET